jgi:phage/plasmid-like protein (TIGR03299 family)
MSHEITLNTRTGQHEMAYTGEKPWHGLGQSLAVGATIEEWTQAAGMAWKIQRAKVRFATAAGAGGQREWPDHHVLFRSDTQAPLGLVSDGFKIVQPKETLEFFRDLVADMGMRLCTAGTLRGGSKFWAQADTGAADCVVGKDKIVGRVLVATACDGTMHTVVKNTAERVVCANTMAVALGEAGSMVKISHRQRFDPAAAKKELGLVMNSFARFMKDARELSKRDVSKKEATLFVAKLLVPATVGEDKMAEALKDATDSKGFRRIMDLFNGKGMGATLPGAKDSAWGLLNAVTQFVDHEAPARTDSNRLESAWFGRGDVLKTKAMEAALELTA